MGSTESIARRARAYEALGREEEAIREYRVAVGVDPGESFSYLDLGRLYTARGAAGNPDDLLEGERYIRQALERQPDSAVAHETLSFNLLQQGWPAAGEGDPATALERFEQAEEAARTSLELNPDLDSTMDPGTLN